MNEILILGLGNLVLKDEGIGIHVVQKLQSQQIPTGVDVLDGGTGGLFLIGTLQQYKHLILIDAALDDLTAGTVRRLKPRFSNDYPRLLSAHEIGLKDMIDAMLIEGNIPQINLLAVSVKNFQSLGIQLSPEVQHCIPQVIQLVYEIIEELRGHNNTNYAC